jgi:ABC-type glycerol-3-phosphate transport system permease component
MKYFYNIIIGFVVLVTVFPLYWMVYTTLLPKSDIYLFPPKIIPSSISIDGYIKIFAERPVITWIINTIIVSIFTMMFSVPPAILAAYAFYRFNFKGKGTLFSMLFILMIVPSAVLLVPFYQLLSSMRLTNNLLGLSFVYTIFTMPTNTVLFYSFLFSIPHEMEEAALIDGCSIFSSFRKIILPLSIPGIVAISVNSFSLAWNEFLFAITLLHKPTIWTAVCGVYSFIGEWTLMWDRAMIVSVYFTIPLIIFFFLTQKYFIAGLTAGAIKGV